MRVARGPAHRRHQQQDAGQLEEQPPAAALGPEIEHAVSACNVEHLVIDAAFAALGNIDWPLGLAMGSALMAGAWVDRARFGWVLGFSALWGLVVVVEELHEWAERLGEELVSPPKPAEGQPAETPPGGG